MHAKRTYFSLLPNKQPFSPILFLSQIDSLNTFYMAIKRSCVPILSIRYMPWTKENIAVRWGFNEQQYHKNECYLPAFPIGFSALIGPTYRDVGQEEQAIVVQ